MVVRRWGVVEDNDWLARGEERRVESAGNGWCSGSTPQRYAPISRGAWSVVRLDGTGLPGRRSGHEQHAQAPSLTATVPLDAARRGNDREREWSALPALAGGRVGSDRSWQDGGGKPALLGVCGRLPRGQHSVGCSQEGLHVCLTRESGDGNKAGVP